MAKLRVPEPTPAPVAKTPAKPAGKPPARPAGRAAPKASAPKPEPAASTEPQVDAFLIQCAPGLSRVMTKELNYVGATTRDQKLFTKLQRNHDLVFLNRAKDDTRLDQLRTAEMVLRCPAYGRFKISQRQLGLITERLTELGPRRLVVSVAGKVFQRQDLARFLTKAVAERGYSFDEDVEEEVWMFCIDESWYFGIPLFKARVLREDRAEEREGALPPTIAAAIAFASVPREEDVVLDPTCGSGTLLSEFHRYASDARLIGRDIDGRAVSIAKRNVPSADIAKGDSRSVEGLALEGTSVTLTLANLPFGVQFGDKKTNPELYRDILRSSLAAKTGQIWRGLFLTSDSEAFTWAAKECGLSSPEVMFKAKIRGELATCYRVKAP